MGAPRHVQTGHRPRHADGQVALVVLLLVVLARGEEHGGRAARGRGLAEVVGHGIAAGRPIKEKAAAPDVAGGGMGDREREGRRDRSVDGIPARPQHFDPHLRGHEVLRDDHALPGADGLGAGGEHPRGSGNGQQDEHESAALEHAE